MNKTKTILAAVGGAAFVAVAAAGYFAWSAHAAKTAALEGDEEGSVGLDSVREKADRLSRKPVYPGAESVKALTVAREEIEAWKDEALAVASRGDRKLVPTTDASFKNFIVDDARRLRSLPAGKDKKTLDEAFDFGPFKPYISEGRIPEQAQLKELQRKWDDMATLIGVLSASGVDSISAIEVKTAAQQPVEEEPKGKNKAKAKKLKAKKAQAARVGVQPSAFTYVVTLKTRPAAWVRALNALATDERFMSVTDMTIRHEKDVLADMLGPEKKDEVAKPTSRRRRRAAAEPEVVAEEKKPVDALYTIVSDPATELPFESKLTVTVYDFRTFDEEREGEVEK